MDWYEVYRQFLIGIKQDHAESNAGYQQQAFQILEQMDCDPDFEIDWNIIRQIESEIMD